MSYTQPMYEVKLRRVRGVVLRERPQVRTPSDISMIFWQMLKDEAAENLLVASLDNKNNLINITRVYSGSINTAVVRIAEIIRPAILNNAARFVMAHNHPSGDPTPGPEDVRVTEMVVEAGKLMDIECLDHIITGYVDEDHPRWVSLKERGLGFR